MLCSRQPQTDWIWCSCSQLRHLIRHSSFSVSFSTLKANKDTEPSISSMVSCGLLSVLVSRSLTRISLIPVWTSRRLRPNRGIDSEHPPDSQLGPLDTFKASSPTALHTPVWALSTPWSIGFNYPTTRPSGLFWGLGKCLRHWFQAPFTSPFRHCTGPGKHLSIDCKHFQMPVKALYRP